MVGGIRGIEILELAVAPIVVAAVHDHPANGCSMPADKFGCGVRDHMRTPFKRAEKIWRGEGVVDEQDQLVPLGDLNNFFNREDRDIRVAQRLAIQNLGVGSNGSFEILRITRIDERHFYSKLRQCISELVIGAAI